MIRITFTQDPIWRSEAIADVRPYGNFAIDTQNSLLYAFVMRDQDHKTRVFRFQLPRFSARKCGDADTITAVELKQEDIVDWFDCDYVDYMQGAAFDNGFIYSVNGFEKGSPHEPVLSVIDTENKKTTLTLDLGLYGLDREPEFIDIYDGQVWYSDASGDLYTLCLVE